jgi:hypothetical protein
MHGLWILAGAALAVGAIIGWSRASRRRRANELRVAFLNCKRLVDPPKPTDTPLADRIRDLAETLLAATDGVAPEFMGLCEIGSKALAEQLGNEVGAGRYQCLWSGVPSHPQRRIGLALLYDTLSADLAAPVTVEVDPGMNTGGRAHWMAARMQLRRAKGDFCFWVVVNHWASRRWPDADRIRSARQIGDLFQRNKARTPVMVLVGDFNAEPADVAFHKTRNILRAVRERSLVLRPGNDLAYFYNPMWRWLPEPDLWDADPPQRPPSRLLGTWCRNWAQRQGWEVFDQLLVTRSGLIGPGLTLREPTVRVVEPVNACTDHCAIGASFRY